MIDGHWIDFDGVLHQRDAPPFTYDDAYLDRNYPTRDDLAEIRLDFLRPFLKPWDCILDHGCGRRRFTKECRYAGFSAFGYDLVESVSTISLCEMNARKWDAICCISCMNGITTSAGETSPFVDTMAYFKHTLRRSKQTPPPAEIVPPTE